MDSKNNNTDLSHGMFYQKPIAIDISKVRREISDRGTRMDINEDTQAIQTSSTVMTM